MNRIPKETRQLMKEIGTRLMFERKIRHFTQEEMAHRLKISDRQLRRYEKGESLMPNEFLRRLYQDFDIDLNYLIYGAYMEDMYVIRGLETMPQDMLEEQIGSIISLDRINDPSAVTEETFHKMIITIPVIADYGLKHFHDKKVRTGPPIYFFTYIHEEWRLPFTVAGRNPKDILEDYKRIE